MSQCWYLPAYRSAGFFELPCEPPGPEAVAAPLDAVGGVFDERKAVAVGETPERDHVGHEAVEVDGDDRLRARSDRRRDGGGVDVRGRGIDVDENGRPARVHDRVRRGQKRHRRRDDFVRGADTRREHGKMQGGGGVSRAHDGGHTEILLESLLEGIDPLSRREKEGIEDVPDGGLFLFPEGMAVEVDGHASLSAARRAPGPPTRRASLSPRAGRSSETRSPLPATRQPWVEAPAGEEARCRAWSQRPRPAPRRART